MITTHVLDTAKGKPAAGIAIELEHEGTLIGSGVTDADGRLRTLTPQGPVTPGTYRIRFQTGAYDPAGFFPVVEIFFKVVDGAQHYHVPLLYSPYGFSTYRGS
ncbi:MAG: hydroxyisourate hydrolase [Kofleriaceae bacterium]